MKSTVRRGIAAATATALVAGGLALGLGGGAALASPADTAPAPLANTAHLDFLLDTPTLSEVPGHTTYELAEHPTVTVPWTYADARDGGTFERVGGGPLDPATGDYAQGAFNSDDVARAAVVYLRDWQQTGSDAAREHAYEVLRGLAYFQTDSGSDAGNVILWMQPDGELNPSAEPVELPDPSDSGDSYWLARTIWAFGEGYAAFRDTDPEFAAFLQERLQLAVGAVDREVLSQYGSTLVADGVTVPAWLIADGADATAEALLGLSAYLETGVDDAGVRDSTQKLAEGVEAMARTTSDGDTTQWPYGAALPWTQSRSMWHAWSSQMPTALVRSAEALGDDSLAEPAVVEGGGSASLLLASGGPDNGWYPSPTERVQIAYGADSRLQASLALADATGSSLYTDLAGLQGAWFFGLNPAGEPMYDPATGVTYDGIQPDGSINRNSGAESTIHGLLSALALDAHPSVAARATSVTTAGERAGISFVQAEDVVSGDGVSVVTPESTWTGESSWNGAYVQVAAGTCATAALGRGDDHQDRIVEPVSWQVEDGTAPAPVSTWTARNRDLGTLVSSVGPEGVTEASGALLPQRLDGTVAWNSADVGLCVQEADLQLDGFLVRPEVVSVSASGDGSTALYYNSGSDAERVKVKPSAGADQALRIYAADGSLVDEHPLRHTEIPTLQPGQILVVAG